MAHPLLAAADVRLGDYPRAKGMAQVVEAQLPQARALQRSLVAASQRVAVQERARLASEHQVMWWRFPKPTPGLEPGTPSLRVSADAAILAFLSHILRSEVCSNQLRFAELGTYFGTRFPAPIRASP
jgi:hypothetical protein